MVSPHTWYPWSSLGTSWAALEEAQHLLPPKVTADRTELETTTQDLLLVEPQGGCVACRLSSSQLVPAGGSPSRAGAVRLPRKTSHGGGHGQVMRLGSQGPSPTPTLSVIRETWVPHTGVLLPSKAAVCTQTPPLPHLSFLLPPEPTKTIHHLDTPKRTKQCRERKAHTRYYPRGLHFNGV